MKKIIEIILSIVIWQGAIAQVIDESLPVNGEFGTIGNDGGGFDATDVGVNTISLVSSSGVCKDTSSINIYIDTCISTGNPEKLTKGFDYRIYPNPANEYIHIAGGEGVLQYKRVKIYDVLGQVILSLRSETNSGQELIIDISKYQRGVYLIQVIGNSGTLTKQLIVR